MANNDYIMYQRINTIKYNKIHNPIIINLIFTGKRILKEEN